jgi:hypothetical protein
MIPKAPKIDSRTAVEVAAQVRALLRDFTPEWKADAADSLAAALIAIFARYSEIIIQRLNEAPRKNFLAFLDLLGASLLPPQPARAPLTFSLAAGSPVGGVVPAGTQVAAPPAEGETQPVIYETERELVVTAAQLDAIFTRDPEADKYSDYSLLVSAAAPDGEPLLEGQMPIDHILYVGDSAFFAPPGLQDVKLEIGFDRVVQDEMAIQWERWDGAGWSSIGSTPQATSTTDAKQTLSFGALDSIPLSKVAGLESRWIRGRLLTPITLVDVKQVGKVRSGQLPSINTPQLTGAINGDVTAEHSFSDQLQLDTSKEFFPFGERPKRGDAWLIAQSEAFSQPGFKIALDIAITKADRDLPANAKPVLVWEFWDGKVWQALNQAPAPVPGEPQAGEVQDNTASLTQSGKVFLRLPAPSVPIELNGTGGSWLRVRLAGGNYGKAAFYTLIDPNDARKGFFLTPETFAPPIIGSLKITYTGSKTGGQEVMCAYNNFVFDLPVAGMPDPVTGTTTVSLKPFRTIDETVVGGETSPTVYFGFALPAGSDFTQGAISLFFSLVEPLYGAASAISTERPMLVWECWNGLRWNKLVVGDDSAALAHSGLVEFLPPADFAAREDFGLLRHWLRVRWESGTYPFEPRARRVLLNTTMATQSVTLRNEVLGSSDGSKNQKFRATRAPILEGPRLEVREPELPSAAEQHAVREYGGDEAIAIVPDEVGRPREVWVQWLETPDFYGSGPRDRHYALDHLTGEIRFGDGLAGLIPPVGAGNLRLTQYRTGGGDAANRPVGAIVQLKTTVPYVDKVTNYEAAAGGADAESLGSLIERAPRSIRHNGRAVTVEDFEDVALLASPEVARARCIPLRNLVSDPLDRNVPVDPLSRLPGLRGQVSVIVVPRSTAVKPLPSLELIKRVQEYLDSRSTLTAHVWVTGPLYLRVDVEVEVALVSLAGAGAVELAVQQSLAAFLHPMTGGLDGKGWDFGREPHLSDLYALIESTPGVDHVNLLNLNERVDDADISTLGLSAATAVADVKKTGRFLVYSGAHKISLKFEEE